MDVVVCVCLIFVVVLFAGVLLLVFLVFVCLCVFWGVFLGGDFINKKSFHF